MEIWEIIYKISFKICHDNTNAHFCLYFEIQSLSRIDIFVNIKNIAVIIARKVLVSVEKFQSFW